MGARYNFYCAGTGPAPSCCLIHNGPMYNPEIMGYAASSPVVYHICGGSVCTKEPAVCVTWLNVGLQYLQCISDGDASVLHQAIHIVPGLWPDVWLAPGCCLYLWWYGSTCDLWVPRAVKWQDGLMRDCSISIGLAMKILQSCAKLSIEYMGYDLMPDWQSGHCQYLWWPYIDGLMQEWCNSLANALELRFLALTHQYKLHKISYMCVIEMAVCLTWKWHMQTHISGWLDCGISSALAMEMLQVCTELMI